MANNEILRKIGSPLTVMLADTTDFDDIPIAQTDQIDLTSLANGGARQSDKFDFGETSTGEWADLYDVHCEFEVDVAPASGEVVSVYIAPSDEPGAALGNPGGIVGADGAYTGTAGDSLADSLKTLEFIGDVICTSDADPVMQIKTLGYSPIHRYGTLVVFNQSGQAFVADATHHYVRFTPVVPEVQ